MTDEVLYGAAEIARALGLSRRVVYHRAAAEQIPTFKMGQTLCAKRSSLAAWLAACDAPAAPITAPPPGTRGSRKAA